MTAALYSGVGVLGKLRILHRAGTSLDAWKRVRDMEGNIRIRACVLLKSCSLPSECKQWAMRAYPAKMRAATPVFGHRCGGGRTPSIPAVWKILSRQQGRQDNMPSYKSTDGLNSLYLERRSIMRVIERFHTSGIITDTSIMIPSGCLPAVLIA